MTELVIMGEPRPHFSVPVRAFHLAFGCAAPDKPGPMDDQTRYARAQLITEEAGELFWALAASDLIEVFDALGDLEYVICGTLVAAGIDTLDGLPEVASTSEGPMRLPPADVGLQLGSALLSGASAVCMALASNRWDHLAPTVAALHTLLGKVWSTFRVPEAVRIAILDEIHASNMTKFGADGKPVVNEAGRVVKGPNFREPDLLAAIRTVLPGWSPPAVNVEVTTPLSGGTR